MKATRLVNAQSDHWILNIRDITNQSILLTLSGFFFAITDLITDHTVKFQPEVVSDVENSKYATKILKLSGEQRSFVYSLVKVIGAFGLFIYAPQLSPDDIWDVTTHDFWLALAAGVVHSIAVLFLFKCYECCHGSTVLNPLLGTVVICNVLTDLFFSHSIATASYFGTFVALVLILVGSLIPSTYGIPRRLLKKEFWHQEHLQLGGISILCYCLSDILETTCIENEYSSMNDHGFFCISGVGHFVGLISCFFIFREYRQETLFLLSSPAKIQLSILAFIGDFIAFGGVYLSSFAYIENGDSDKISTIESSMKQITNFVLSSILFNTTGIGRPVYHKRWKFISWLIMCIGFTLLYSGMSSGD
mmetsp:Transcript_28503/g.31661  ORF Transcript_28503/g.31661 Transcript_28503/m.31661 type:complete len:362 (+) Transcript_28503:97-1182(+)